MRRYSLSLIETELFGSERGAYTDAISRPGCFQLADQGTLFLDEIGDFPSPAKRSSCAPLNIRKYCRGGLHPVKTDVRIISATNRNLRKEMSRRRFRSDLYYRISTLILPIPPLRERKEDIPILVQSFIEEEGKNRFLERAAFECLYEYDWPGNIRELRSVVKRALVISRSERIERRDIVFDRDE